MSDTTDSGGIDPSKPITPNNPLRKAVLTEVPDDFEADSPIFEESEYVGEGVTTTARDGDEDTPPAELPNGPETPNDGVQANADRMEPSQQEDPNRENQVDEGKADDTARQAPAAEAEQTGDDENADPVDPKTAIANGDYEAEGVTNDDLREELESRDLPKSGNKDELVARLRENDEQNQG